MNVIFITAFCGEDLFRVIQDKSKLKLSASSQTFNKYFLQGMLDNKVNVKVFSYLPVSAFPGTKIRFISKKYIDKYNLLVIPFLNFQYVKQFYIAISLLFELFKHLLTNNKETKPVIVCDYYYLPISLPALFIAKIFKLQSVVIIPDIPKLIVKYAGTDKRISNSMLKLYFKLSDRIIKYYSAYILFSKKMEKKLNLCGHSVFVIEGIYNIPNANIQTFEKKNAVLYTGGLYSEYGIMELIESIAFIEDQTTEIWICGNGPLADIIEKISEENKRVKYLGMVSHEESLLLQQKAKIVINPRSSKEEFTHYSFPSKTFEYMTSGSEVIMTKLPGIPEEYFQYIHILEDCSSKCIAKTINEINLLSENECKLNSMNSYAFIRDFKNPYIQASRIIDFFQRELHIQ